MTTPSVDELVEGITEHLQAARAAGAAADEAAVRTLLHRLGSPSRSWRPPRGVVGWLVGVALLWWSGRWTWREKLLGTLVVPGGPGGILVFGLTAGGHTGSGSIRTTSDGTVTSQADSCSGFSLRPAVGIALLLASVVGPFVVAVILYGRVRSRAAAE